MSDSDYRGHHGTELRNVTDGPSKKRGCCTRHPRVCCCLLLFFLVLAIIVGALLGAFTAVIGAKVDDAIGQVSENMVDGGGGGVRVGWSFLYGFFT